MTANLSRRAAAEFFGTAFLVAAVVGSGIIAERLAPTPCIKPSRTTFLVLAIRNYYIL
jgi:glycerol uptake facilitator-like aquaporin